MILRENQQNRQTFIQTKQKAERISKLIKSEIKRGHKNRHGGDIDNHQVIFQKPVLHKIGKPKGNGQFSG